VRSEVRLAAASLAVGLLAAGCPRSERPAGQPTADPLSFTIEFEAPASSARARVVSVARDERRETPWYPVQPGPARITVSGLKPDTSYAHTVQVATVDSETITLHAVHATTPPLPPGNHLAYTVSFEAPGTAARARVVSTAPDERLETPWFAVRPGRASIDVLGLKAETSYRHAVEVETIASETQVVATVRASTPPLPRDVASFAMVFTGTQAPPRGYFLFGGSFGHEIAFDEKGTIRWYSEPTRVSGHVRPTQEWKIQYDGSMTAYVGSSRGWEHDRGEFVRFTPLGLPIARYSQSSDPTEPGNPPLLTDPHELQITRDASGREVLHYFAYLFRPTGPSRELAAWHELLRTTPDGRVLFRWKAWEHIADEDPRETLPGPDADHPNSLEIDADGNYVVSFRQTDEVMKIDSGTGAVLWRFGGPHDQFRLEGDPLGGFSGQHSVRVLPGGHLLLFDNGLRLDPPESRGVEYALDTKAMTATMVWQYRHVPAIFAVFVGSIERLAPGGDTLVGFSLFGTVCGVDASGRLLWEGQGKHEGFPAKSYRIRWVPSLYGPEPR
jgi:hypothetical protein